VGITVNTTYCVEVNGEDLSCCSNKIESVCLRKCLHDHRLTNKAYLHAVTVTTFLRVFTYKMAAKINWHRYRTKLRHSHPTHTDSERPNRCCHLPSKAENIDRTPNISYTLQWAGRCPSTNLGNRPPQYVVHWSHVRVCFSNGTSIGSSVFVGLMIMTNRQTETTEHR